MKKCVIQKEMADTKNHQSLKELNIPVKLAPTTSPFFGIQRCPLYNFGYNFDKIQNAHLMKNNAI